MSSEIVVSNLKPTSIVGFFNVAPRPVVECNFVDVKPVVLCHAVHST